MNNYTAIIKKFKGHYVALCPELNVSAQGESLLEARGQLRDAITEFLKYSREEHAGSSPLDFETLSEFLIEADDTELERDQEVSFFRNFSTQIPVQI